MKLQLVHRLMLIIGAALVPISALQAWSTFELERQQVSATESDALRLLALIEDQQAATIAGVRQVLAVLRQTKVIIERDWPGCQDLLSRTRDELPDYLSVYVTDDRGINVCAAEPRAVGLDSSRREHIAAALAGKPFATGSRIITRASGKSALPLALPIRDGTTGAVTGTVAALLDTGSLDTALAAKPLPSGATLTVADRTGTIIARTPDRTGLLGTRLPDSFEMLAFQRSTGVRRMVDLDGATRLIAFSPPDAGATELFIALGLDQTSAAAALRDTRSHAMVLLVTVAAGTALSVLWMGHLYVRIPAASLSDSARRWRAGELGARAEVRSSAVEFARLAADFNAMADALDLRERALRSTSEQHRAVFETAVDAIVVIDETGIVQSLNPATEKTFGYAAGELLGSNVRILMGAEHRAFHNAYIRNYLETGVRRIIGIGRTVEGRRNDGTLFPLELSIAEWRDQSGRRFFTGIMRDISARVAAERQAEDERSRLRRIVDGAPFPVMVHAETGEILHISGTWLDLTGYARDELVRVADWAERAYGRDVSKHAAVLSDIERLYQLDRALDEGEHVVRTASGARRTWAFRSAPVGRDAAGRRLVVTMAADVTERRDGEERVRLLMREVDHRAKNALMVVQSIVQLSRSEDPAEFSRAVEGRIRSSPPRGGRAPTFTACCLRSCWFILARSGSACPGRRCRSGRKRPRRCRCRFTSWQPTRSSTAPCRALPVRSR
ncbi:PAS domain S-box-containing protein [Skermanella aerolata]|uniref:PAS domain S-box protein n=1 Tax=Skermanella aerolata TaxID=393310 RepID=UPI003D223E1D